MELMLWILLGIVLHTRYCYLGLEIKECPSGEVDVTEGSTVSFSCGFSIKLYWHFGNRDCPTKYTSRCRGSPCRDSNATSFRIKESTRCFYSYACIGTLTISNASREHACSFSCTHYEVDETDASFTDQCKLRIIAPTRYTPGSCRLGLTNWRVNGSCTAEGMYASDNTYTCQWLSYNNQKFGEFQGGLETYTANSKEYKRGHCSFVAPMPTAPGVYSYRAKVSPGPDVYFNGTVYISPPEELMHNCPEHVLEGSDLTCTCTTSKVESPSAQTIWDGLSNETLQVKSVTRQLIGKHYTCRLLWGPNGYINRSTPYILKMAYGPAAVLIHRTSEEKEIESETVCFTCTAIDVLPSAVFTWSHTCRNRTDSQNNSICSFSLKQIGDNTVISCTANNSIFASVSSSYTYRIRTPVSAVGGIISGVIAAVIGTIGVVSIVTLIIKHRQGPVYDPDERSFLIPRGGSADERSSVDGSETTENRNDQQYRDMTINNSQLDATRGTHSNNYEVPDADLDGPCHQTRPSPRALFKNFNYEVARRRARCKLKAGHSHYL